ncbi:hypothetical protein C2I36_00940 [Rhodobacteraceae bacterium WD3A24]|nr:hypothetical protein C2I36_00940 [Rhodobacteraceae bacterium WD3A24]
MARKDVLTTVAALALGAGGTAGAQVTADEVWNSWEAMLSGMNYDVTVADRSRSGNRLTLDGVTLSTQVERTEAQMELDKIVLTERDDGSVAVAMPPETPFELIGPQGRERMLMAYTIVSPGLEVVVSGGPDDMRYDVTAPTMTVSLDTLVDGGEPLDAEFAAELSDLATIYAVAGADLESITASQTIGSVSVSARGTDPDNPDTSVDFTASISDLEGSSQIDNVMEGDRHDDPGAAIEAGFGVSTTLAHGPMSFAFSAQSAGAPTSSSGSAEGGGFDMAMTGDGLRLHVETAGLSVTSDVPEMPFPVSVAFDEFATGFEMPVLPSETPQPFSLLTSLRGLTVGEELWSMFDPAGMLPREPANFVFDVSGQARVTENFLNRSEMEDLPKDAEEAPGELHELDLNELRFSFAGADLQGSGAFSFDNSDMTTFEGMPRPTGSAEARLTGANALLDTLAQMGVFPPDQVMAGRMMMGMFFRPTGDDVMTSNLEITEEGSILINGQQMPQ